ncbi:MAG: FitA-like ribbon-helix-helix domain-containing protein [Microvirga sp.]|jgi:antitoxin FitA
MGQVLVRQVDDDTIESYKLKAKIKGISLEQELRNLLEANKPFTPEERVAVSRHFRAQCKGIQPSLTLDEIREGLE